MTGVAVLSEKELEDLVRRAVEPLRVALERLQAEQGPALVPLAEAARRLGVTRRAVQRWAKDGRLVVEVVGGIRMVRLPVGLGGR